MKNGQFTDEELEYLRSLDAVERAEPRRITYSMRFKEEFMRRYHDGERPKAIFESAGLIEPLIGYKRIERACAHWREAEAKDALCLTDDKVPACDDMRAKERPKSREQMIIQSQAEEIEALKAQVRALKRVARRREGPSAPRRRPRSRRGSRRHPS